MLNSPIKSPFWMVNSLKNHWIPRSPGQGVKGKGIGGDGFLSHLSNLAGASRSTLRFLLVTFHVDFMMV